MRSLFILFSVVLLIFSHSVSVSAQSETDSIPITYKIIKQNGAAFVGSIVSKDAREILMQTEEVGLVYIPKHEIEEIIVIETNEEIVTGGLFATRYFLTTNGFNIRKGDNYIQWNLFGPDFQFGVADNFTLGIMTSWVGIPIIGTAKYSKQFTDSFYGGIGFLGGTGSWAFPEYGLLLPFGFLSKGNRMNNINITAGYGVLFTEQSEQDITIYNAPTEYSTNSYDYGYRDYNDAEGRVLLSAAGMFRINDKYSFVFDSFFMLPGKDKTREELQINHNQATGLDTYAIRTETMKSNPLFVLLPGLRFQANESSSFQFGFTGVHFEGEFLPVPIPMVQLFKRI